MIGPDAAELNRALTGFSELLQFDLMASPDRTAYTLTLTLASRQRATLVLVCQDVQNLELNPAGNGFAQMLRLEVTDMRSDGLERIHFSLEEVECETLFLHCAQLQLQSPQP